jgi:ribosome silencing factor RsfS/YbeB/iojap
VQRIERIKTPDYTCTLSGATSYARTRVPAPNCIDLTGKSSIGDYMVVTSGRSQRHVGAVADHLVKDIEKAGVARVRVEGMRQGDWVLIDAGDVIVHVFRPEVRDFYNLEKMWAATSKDARRPG